MPWLWYVGPIALVLLYFLTGRTPKRQLAEIERWRAAWGGGRGAKRVAVLQRDFAGAIDAIGGGDPLGTFELVPKLAYLGVYGPTLSLGSDHQTVVARLADPAPTFSARPLPIVDGVRVPNTGVIFKKDPDFSAVFLVEGADPKGVKKWLGALAREQLLEHPQLWLRVSGRVMALSFFGPFDAQRIETLVAVADILFAEYGDEGGPSLLGDDLGEQAPAPPPKKAPKPKKAAPDASGKAPPDVAKVLSESSKKGATKGA